MKNTKKVLVSLVLGASLVSVAAYADDVADGKALFDAKGCAACHGTAPGAASPGPNLIGVGARRGTEAAVAAQIENPVNKPDNAVMMPAGLANKEESAKIAKYLMTLK